MHGSMSKNKTTELVRLKTTPFYMFTFKKLDKLESFKSFVIFVKFVIVIF